MWSQAPHSDDARAGATPEPTLIRVRCGSASAVVPPRADRRDQEHGQPNEEKNTTSSSAVDENHGPEADHEHACELHTLPFLRGSLDENSRFAWCGTDHL